MITDHKSSKNQTWPQDAHVVHKHANLSFIHLTVMTIMPMIPMMKVTKMEIAVI